MTLPRKRGLGQYNANRTDWRVVYRLARIAQRDGFDPDPATDGIIWKAGLIVTYERRDYNDPLTHPVASRLGAKRIIESLINEKEQQ